MALGTLGTNANNSLASFLVGTDDVTPAQIALLNLGILNDQINGRPKINQSYVKKGLLFIPNRGLLRLLDGDYIAIDATTGWPIVVSADCAANGAYTHS